MDVRQAFSLSGQAKSLSHMPKKEIVDELYL